MTGSLQQYLPGMSQGDCARISVEQGVPNMLFQLPNLLRKRRLGDVQPFRGSAKMQLLGYGDKITKMAQLNLGIHM
jgi:hypothetical protein